MPTVGVRAGQAAQRRAPCLLRIVHSHPAVGGHQEAPGVRKPAEGHDRGRACCCGGAGRSLTSRPCSGRACGASCCRPCGRLSCVGVSHVEVTKLLAGGDVVQAHRGVHGGGEQQARVGAEGHQLAGRGLLQQHARALQAPARGHRPARGQGTKAGCEVGSAQQQRRRGVRLQRHALAGRQAHRQGEGKTGCGAARAATQAHSPLLQHPQPLPGGAAPRTGLGQLARPKGAHHSSALPSLLAEAAHSPSLEKAMAHTSLLCCSSTCPGCVGSCSQPTCRTGRYAGGSEVGTKRRPALSCCSAQELRSVSRRSWPSRRRGDCWVARPIEPPGAWCLRSLQAHGWLALLSADEAGAPRLAWKSVKSERWVARELKYAQLSSCASSACVAAGAAHGGKLHQHVLRRAQRARRARALVWPHGGPAARSWRRAKHVRQPACCAARRGAVPTT